MRSFRYLHAIISRFAPMDESEALELHGEAQKAYTEQLDSAKIKLANNEKRQMLIAKNAENPDPKFVAPPLETLTLGDKVTMYSEKWYSRYGFAMLYVLSVPVIRDYMNGDDSEEEGEDDDDLETLQMLRMMQKMKKYKKS